MLYVLSFAVFSLAIAGMALGVLLGRPPIAGSCGRDCGCRPTAGEAPGADPAAEDKEARR